MVAVSGKNRDDLMARSEAKFKPNKSSSKPNASPPQTIPQASMEQMLDRLRADLESGRGRPNSVPQQSENSIKQDKTSVVDAARQRDLLNALIDTDYRRQAHKREQKRAEIKRREEAKQAEAKRRESAKLAEQKRQEEAKQAEAKRRQQELIELQQQEELRNRRRKEALREEAKQWLVKLDPKSEEGRWFKEFSYSYENKLQAAIDYLEAMRETGL